ncbi:ARM repeat-containing protein [Pluteus cervinus]|uniref:ARM repeat-containing protein n=1 Tax=Pluteus cervinus TaxID=181527 RepID=A0ACD3ADR5_9AGAR|nr:ARM repeat-containing protein [Pluteus cervinus]
MDTAIAKQLVDKIYEKRKAAALELEKQIRECHHQHEEKKINQIIEQLIDMFSNSTNAMHIRNGGLIGLAGTAIALGVDVAPYMDKFINPLLSCFVDPENRVRYFSAECLYNIAKVSKGEVLVFFNDIFDALSKLAADSESSVKNGAELLDRLLKDIVAESASVYIPLYPETEKIRSKRYDLPDVLVPHPAGLPDTNGAVKKAFSLAHFIPLLRERIYVVSPFTRSYLVSWLTVLDSVPELELISYLPQFLDGLLKYLSDPIEDVRVATETLLGDFLREIHEVAMVKRRVDEEAKAKAALDLGDVNRKIEATAELPVDTGEIPAERNVFIAGDDETALNELTSPEDLLSDIDEKDTGAWIPGQGVKIDYAAIIEILIQQLDDEHDEIQQSTALQWLAEFLLIVPECIVPFTPRLIPAILPKLAHHAQMIKNAALRTNHHLSHVIQILPSPPEAPRQVVDKPPPNARSVVSPTPTASSGTRQVPIIKEPVPAREGPADTDPSTTQTLRPKSSGTTTTDATSSRTTASGEAQQPPATSASSSRPHSPVSFTSQNVTQTPIEDIDPFDYRATVNGLTVQFLSEFEETRVAALKWLIMLHQKAPKKILAMDDGTFPALLKTLSDRSEEVIKHDLQLLAQISSSSEESYFQAFMHNLLELFSTDLDLLETRGSLIIRQLCLNLNTERIYRAFAEILEKEEDLEFASVIVQKLNMILITSPELADFRRRLKNLETRQDGQALFTTLYRSWCHNAVAVFSLCLLAQAYEHASNLLYIFADLEITVQLLIQIDKLVQLIESPVFTYLRLQLLEPERYPHLFKCLYGILMLLPQSSAFVSLRNRLNAVNSAGFLHIAPKPSISPLATRSKLGREEIKWQELLQHFRFVQAKHEKARRQALGADASPISEFDEEKPIDEQGTGAADRGGRSNPSGAPARPPIRRKVTGAEPPMAIPSRAGALSPLNPRARLMGVSAPQVGTSGPGVSLGNGRLPRRTMDLNRKT